MIPVLLALLACAPEPSEQEHWICTIPNCPGLYAPRTVEIFVGDPGPYFLAAQPTAGSLEVAVVDAGTTYTFHEGAAWVWEPIPNAVAFDRYVPPPDAEVHVAYTSAAQTLEVELHDQPSCETWCRWR